MTDDPVVCLPNQSGTFDVVDLGQLIDGLAEGRDLDDAASGAAIDTVDPADPEAIARVRRLNETGDAAAYWNLR